MGAHLIDGKLQSDKYPSTPRGKVPLSCEDRSAQELLWEYAQRCRSVDGEFSADLEAALKLAGYCPSACPLSETLERAARRLVLDEEGYRAKAMDASRSVEDRAAGGRRADAARNLAETCWAAAQHFRSLTGSASG